jgi:parallel beta-helix repeat protein
MRLIASFLLILTAAAANAADYYVSPSGSNANSGSSTSPWQTITYGFGRLNAGDTLWVRSGTYNETLTIWNKNGTSTAWYTVKAYTGEKPVMDGTGKSGNGVVVIGGDNPSASSYIRIEGLEIKNGGVNGIFLYDAHHIELLNNDVHHNTKRGISVTTASGSAFGTTHHVLVQGNDVHHNVLENTSLTAASWQQGLSTIRADSVDVIGNKVHENYGEGLDIIQSDNALVSQNEVWDNFSVNIYLDNAQYTKVDRNFVAHGISATPSSFYRSGNPASGIYIANEWYSFQNPSTNLTITNNIVLRTRLGIAYSNSEYGGGLHQTLIANNTVFETDNLLLWFENGTTDVHTTTTVQNNIFYAKTGTNYAYGTSSGITYISNNWYNGNSSSRKTGLNDVLTNPNFASPGTLNAISYKLTSGSGCIDTGTTHSSVTTDHWGTARGVLYDIGAHEY